MSKLFKNLNYDTDQVALQEDVTLTPIYSDGTPTFSPWVITPPSIECTYGGATGTMVFDAPEFDDDGGPEYAFWKINAKTDHIGWGNTVAASDTADEYASTLVLTLDSEIANRSPNVSTITATRKRLDVVGYRLGPLDGINADKPLAPMSALSTKADLVDGKVPSSQLPSYVDDVIEGYLKEADGKFYTTKSGTTYSGEITPEAGKIYVDKDTSKTYRWGGSQYGEISAGVALGETASTAYRGDRGKTAYDHSQLTSGNPHNVTKTDVGLGSVVNTGDSATPVSGGTTKFTTGGAYTELNKKLDKTGGDVGPLNVDGSFNVYGEFEGNRDAIPMFSVTPASEDNDWIFSARIGDGADMVGITFEPNSDGDVGMTFKSVLGESRTLFPGNGGTIAVTSDISAAIGTLNTNNTAAQSVNASESFSGTINLHKVAKTGNYNDLLNKPYAFTTVAAKANESAQAVNVQPDSATDTLTLVGGNGVNLTGDATNDKVTFGLTDGGVTTAKIADGAITLDKMEFTEWTFTGTSPEQGYHYETSFDEIAGMWVLYVVLDGYEHTSESMPSDMYYTPGLTGNETSVVFSDIGVTASRRHILPTNTSHLVNDGEDGTHPFITAEDVPDPTLSNATTDWHFAIELTAEQKTAFSSKTGASTNDYALSIDGISLKVGTYVSANLTISQDGLTATFLNAGGEIAGDALWTTFGYEPGDVVATKVSAYQLGDQDDKLLAKADDIADIDAALTEAMDGSSSGTISDLTTLISSKADKATSFTPGNYVMLDSNGNIIDSGHRHSEYSSSAISVMGIKQIISGSIVLEDDKKVYRATLTASSGAVTVPAIDGSGLTFGAGFYFPVELELSFPAGTTSVIWPSWGWIEAPPDASQVSGYTVYVALRFDTSLSTVTLANVWCIK